MFRRKARQFFFFVMASSLLFIFSAFSVPEPIKTHPFVLYLQDKGRDVFKELKYSAPVVPKSVLQQAEQIVEQAKETAGYEERVTVDPETGAYLFKGKKYVYIEGQYHPYNPTHRYKVNGMTVFHKVSKSEALLKKEKKEAYLRKIRGESDPENHQEITEYTPQMGLKAASPDNIQKMMKSLKQSQRRLQERNSALEQVMRAQ